MLKTLMLAGIVCDAIASRNEIAPGKHRETRGAAAHAWMRPGGGGLYCIRTILLTTTSVTGTSDWPLTVVVGTAPMASMTSRPWVILPNTV
jgi:hypothetical protein